MNEPLMPTIGPGSQPAEDDGELTYMQMPSGMMTFSAAHLPEAGAAAGHEKGVAALEAILAALRHDGAATRGATIGLSGLDAADLAFVDQILGEGEVSIVCGGEMQIQESVLAGVWRIREAGGGDLPQRDFVEVGAIPSAVPREAFRNARAHLVMPESAGPNIFNAPPLVAEINEHVEKAGDGADPHVINLSLLPHTEEDLAFLDGLLGRSGVVILSRGYGNCRITATATHHTWWVQFYNSQDTLILNTIEIARVPLVACASAEDIADSAERLDDILGIYR